MLTKEKGQEQMRKVRKIIWIAAFSASILLNVYLLRDNVHNYLAGVYEKNEAGRRNTSAGSDRVTVRNAGKPDKGSVSEIGLENTGKRPTGLDFTILDSLSNEKYSWGLPGNNEHNPPEAPSTTVRLLEKYNGIYLGDTTSEKLYLTFDEGYENGYTPEILDTLKKMLVMQNM
jgi:hypothetical protein